MDNNTCSDACTHSNKAVGPQVGLLEQSHCGIQGHPCFYVIMHRGVKMKWGDRWT